MEVAIGPNCLALRSRGPGPSGTRPSAPRRHPITRHWLEPKALRCGSQTTPQSRRFVWPLATQNRLRQKDAIHPEIAYMHTNQGNWLKRRRSTYGDNTPFWKYRRNWGKGDEKHISGTLMVRLGAPYISRSPLKGNSL